MSKQCCSCGNASTFHLKADTFSLTALNSLYSYSLNLPLKLQSNKRRIALSDYSRKVVFFLNKVVISFYPISKIVQ